MGQVIDSPCAPCRGDGRIVKDVEHTVEVPAGINTGQTLRVSGRGAVGIRGGGAGDLYVHVRVAEHDTYRREEDDLVVDVVISIAQATLGTHLVLSTLDGDEDLIVPPGVQQGREFLLKGRGVPHLNQGGRNRGRGNLRAQIVIAVPTKLSDAERDLLTRFAEARGEHVTQTESKLKSKIKSAFL
jgi:molecular chaperone DnaJ